MFVADHALTQSGAGGAKDAATFLSCRTTKPGLNTEKWHGLDDPTACTTPDPKQSMVRTPSTPYSQISTAPGTPSASFLDDFCLDSVDDSALAGGRSPFRLDGRKDSFEGVVGGGPFVNLLDQTIQEEVSELEECAEGEIAATIAFLNVFQSQPTCYEEDAEGDIVELVAFLNTFKSAEEDCVEKMMEEGKINHPTPFMKTLVVPSEHPVEGDVGAMIAFLNVFCSMPITYEEKAEGNMKELVSFLQLFNGGGEPAEGNISAILSFLKVFDGTCTEEAAEGNIRLIQEFLKVFAAAPAFFNDHQSVEV